MKLLLSLFFNILITSLALAEYPETYRFEKQYENYSCKIELKLESGEYKELNLESKLVKPMTLTDEELINNTDKAWPKDITFNQRFDKKIFLWKEAVINGSARKTAQDSTEYEDKLKVFFDSTNGSFRSIIDMYVKIIPIDNGKSAKILIGGIRESEKSAKEFFDKKLNDQTEVNESECFKLNFKPTGANNVAGEIWGVKVLSKDSGS